MDNELEPCPFCGGKPKLDSVEETGDEQTIHHFVRHHFVRCVSCAAEGGWSKGISGARNLWNMRTSKRIEAAARAFITIWDGGTMAHDEREALRAVLKESEATDG